MSDLTPSVQLRLARRDELGTILSWLDDPTLLAVTNMKRMSPETVAETKEVIKAKIADESIWIAVRDNFRIGAIYSDTQSPNADSSERHASQKSKSIFVFTKARLDWALLSDTVSEVWRNQVLDPAHPISVMRSPLSGTDAPSNLNLLDDTNNDLLKAEDNSLTRHSIQINKIRILGPKNRNESIRKKLCEQGFEVTVSPDPYDTDSIDDFAPDLILSSGYDRLLGPKTVQKYSQRIVNLHAAYLPWARGIGTTLFATMLRYPYGVSVHFINEGLDTGNLIARKLVRTEQDDTLRTLYSKLLSATEELFFENFPKIVAGQTNGVPQEELGDINTNRSRLQFESVIDACPQGYDTLITDLEKFRDSLEASNALRNALLTNSNVKV